jgi:hypothetical protein
MWRRLLRPRGRVLAIKLGMNPNSSSLGADVTFLLFGAAAVGVLTPFIASLLRLRRPRPTVAGAGHAAPPDPPPAG